VFLDLTFAWRVRGNTEANVKSTTLEHGAISPGSGFPDHGLQHHQPHDMPANRLDVS
jgi:hypothetical protein